MDKEELLCTHCSSVLEYKESTFSQYQPSEYRCPSCRSVFSMTFIDGYKEGLKRQQSASGLVPLDVVEVTDYITALNNEFNEKLSIHVIATGICTKFGSTFQQVKWPKQSVS